MVFSFQHVYSLATLAIIFHYFLATDDGARQVALDRGDNPISPSVHHPLNIRYRFHDCSTRLNFTTFLQNFLRNFSDFFLILVIVKPYDIQEIRTTDMINVESI